MKKDAKAPAGGVPADFYDSWGKRFPDELTAIFNATSNMEQRIHALMPEENT